MSANEKRKFSERIHSVNFTQMSGNYRETGRIRAAEREGATYEELPWKSFGFRV